MQYQDYIWDLGGTLLDNYETSSRAFVETLADFGRKADKGAVYGALKQSTQDAIETFAQGLPGFLDAYKAREKAALSHPQLFEGAKPLLERIVTAGGRNFLVTHRNHNVTEVLDATNISAYFTEVVTSDAGFARKPSPESFLYLKEKYQLTNALVIGDRLIDVTAGRAAGFASMLYHGQVPLDRLIEV